METQKLQESKLALYEEYKKLCEELAKITRSLARPNFVLPAVISLAQNKGEIVVENIFPLAMSLKRKKSTIQFSFVALSQQEQTFIVFNKNRKKFPGTYFSGEEIRCLDESRIDEVLAVFEESVAFLQQEKAVPDEIQNIQSDGGVQISRALH